MFRGRGSATDLRTLAAGRRLEIHELLPVGTPDYVAAETESMQRAALRGTPSPSAASLQQVWDGTSPGPISSAAKRELFSDSGSPKKANVPSHRRKAPMLLLLGAMLVTLLLGAAAAVLHHGDQAAATAESSSVFLAPTGDVLVEFTAPGLWLPLRNALDARFPEQPAEKELLAVSVAAGAGGPKQGGLFDESLAVAETQPGPRRGMRGGASPAAVAVGSTGQWRPAPEGLKILIGVPSACCSKISLERRAAIRRTWAALARQRYPDALDIKFFLAQPKDAEAARQWLPALEAELRKHNDTVILRGEDKYTKLPNKTFRLLRYMLAHPEGYTHVLKADDDTYVRAHRLMDALAGAGSAEAGRHPGLWGRRAASMRKQLEAVSQQRGKPIVSDAMSTYDATLLVQDAEEAAARGGSEGRTALAEALDDIDGEPVTMAELARRRGGRGVAEAAPTLAERLMGGVEAGNALGNGAAAAAAAGPRMTGVYMGALEVRAGYIPIRDPRSKWFISHTDLPDSDVPWGVQYLAGWGQVLSADLARHVIQKVNTYQSAPDQAPAWFNKLNWEDVLVGVLLHDVVPLPQGHAGFRPPWRACNPDTIVRHLDNDSPRLLAGLFEQEASGLMEEKPVQCSSGPFVPGDYRSWKTWKDSLEGR